MTIAIPSLDDLQASVQDRSAFEKLSDYFTICLAFLSLLQRIQPTRVISPTDHNYIFYQYDRDYGHKITRPLNADLFFEVTDDFKNAFERFIDFLTDLKKFKQDVIEQEAKQTYLASNEINRVIYTIQQSIGCIGDSFNNPNQSRKRIGQLFEMIIKLIIQEVGLTCESRTINLPIPNHPKHEMSYQLDLVFSRDKAVITSETKFIHPSEIVGSIKTTSKDRIDKVFLDKYMLTHLLGRDITVIAIFLHDVQRARKGNSIFGVNTTFKSNHFLGYTVALNKLDGVYYVDPRPAMSEDRRLNQYIQDFQQFLIRDLWILSS
ncbi:MAG TPA: hypothetical protein VGD99_22065 [Anaerolineae bacterium]|jgi:hypothetical protein